MTVQTIDLLKTPTDLKKLLSFVTKGNEVLLTEGSKPVARVLPMATPEMARVPGLHAGAISTSDDFDAPLPDEFWTGQQ
jgi:antitoxin (DNA-binding transcriptional repressor) of toxin-antitoxin stability system